MLEASTRACARKSPWRAGAQVRTPMRGASSWLTSMRACATLVQVHARVRHVTCEPLRARHTVALYWLTLVRRARTTGPMHHAQPRADCHVTRVEPARYLVLAAPMVKNTRDFYIFPPPKSPYYIFPQTIKSITYFPSLIHIYYIFPLLI
ncbi:hypothetical protein Hanom_Chr14g01285731 [Helianthus anomalus]